MMKLANRAIKEQLTVRQLEDLVTQAKQVTPLLKKRPKKPLKPAFVVESEEKLIDKFGTSCHIVEKGDGKGKIEIEYLSSGDLTRILDILNIRID